MKSQGNQESKGKGKKLKSENELVKNRIKDVKDKIPNLLHILLFSFYILLFLFIPSLPAADTFSLTPTGELQDNSPSQSPDAGHLLAAIEKRKADLDKRAEGIEEENRRLQALKMEINTLLGKFTQEKESSKRTKEEDPIDGKQLEHLSKIYESMSSKDAAARIQRLPEPLALKLLSSIKPKVAAKILNEIKPSKAAHLTERLAKTSPPQRSVNP